MNREVTLDHLPAQFDFYECQDPIAAFIGGLGYGKTFAAADWVIAGMLEYPLANHFIFSNTYPQLTTGTLETFYERCEHWGLNYYPRVRDLHQIVFPDIPAKVSTWSVDRPINFKSLEIGRGWIDEAQAWKKDAYDKVLGRLRGTRRARTRYPGMALQLRITANPTHTFNHWLYEQTHTATDPKTGKPPIRLFTATTYDNPFLPQAYIDTLEASYDPDVARAELHGEFIELGRGKAFRKYDKTKHYLTAAMAAKLGLPPLKYDPTLPLCWAHDFNLDPLCSILFQWRRLYIDGYQRDVMYVLDAIRISDALISDAPKALLDRPDAVDVARRNGILLYGDASGNSGNRQTGESDWAALRNVLAGLGFRGDARVPNQNPERKRRFASANRMFEDANGNVGVVINADAPALNGDRMSGIRFLDIDLSRSYFKPGTFEIEFPKPAAGEVLPPSQQLTHLGDAFSYPIDYEYPYTEPRPPSSILTAR